MALTPASSNSRPINAGPINGPAPSGFYSAGLELPLSYIRSAALELPLGYTTPQAAGLDLPLPYIRSAALELPLPYRYSAALELPLGYHPSNHAELELPLSYLGTDPKVATLVLPLPMLGAAPLEISDSVTLTANGEDIGFVSIEFSRDQEQTYWSADIELADLEGYHRVPIGTAFTLSINGTDHVLLVDSRELSHTSPVDRTPTVRGISAAAAYDAPFAAGIDYTLTEPALASGIVAALLPAITVTWDMIDWVIPAYRLAVTGMTPMAIAAKIATAAGGVLEALPDGNVQARPAYPVTVPDFATATPDAYVTTLDDIYEVQESLSAARGHNKVRVYDVAPDVQLTDTMEWEADPDDGRTGTLRAYLSPWRDGVTLRQTRGSAVTLTTLGARTRTVEDELVEIKAGEGATQYPVQTIISAAYEADDLGAVSIAPYTKAVRTSTADYSLLRITYTTKSMDWTGTATADLTAQMVLKDSDD